MTVSSPSPRWTHALDRDADIVQHDLPIYPPTEAKIHPPCDRHPLLLSLHPYDSKRKKATFPVFRGKRTVNRLENSFISSILGSRQEPRVRSSKHLLPPRAKKCQLSAECRSFHLLPNRSDVCSGFCGFKVVLLSPVASRHRDVKGPWDSWGLNGAGWGWGALGEGFSPQRR